MKNKRARWTQLLDYIDMHIEQPLTTQQLCQVIHWSPYHFHRQFMACFGINLAEYIKHVRFKRAAYLLVYRHGISITDIGLILGFERAEVFSRAFKHWAGCSPRAFRQQPPWAFIHRHSHQLNQIRDPIMPIPLHHYRVDIVQFEALPVAVLPHHGAPERLGQSVNQFIHWRKTHGLHPSRFRTFNIIYTPMDIEPQEAFRLDLAVEHHQPITPNTNKIEAGIIAAGLCARILYQGEDTGLSLAVEYLYRNWLPASQYELRDAPLFFERIRFFPDVPANLAHTQIYLPVLAKNI